MLSRSTLPYEFRRGQLDMARAVERSLQESKHLIVEAGTGTGKTHAYLLPAFCAPGSEWCIATGTKNLQEQLFFRDLPFLESLLGQLQGLLYERPPRTISAATSFMPCGTSRSSMAWKRSMS